MTTRTCSICNIRRVGGMPKVGDAELATSMGYCTPCLTEADWENMHSDYGHDIDGPDSDDSMASDVRVISCWTCHPELIPALPGAPRTSHTNTRAHSHTSHADHNHPRTPQARATCRKSMAAGRGPLDMRCTCGDRGTVLIHSRNCPCEPRHA